MNTQLFSQAKEAAAAKDFASALRLYTDCLQDPENPPFAGEIGQIYHQIGNCLVRLRNYAEATNAYTQALSDTMYDNGGTLHYNLGQAYAALRDYDNAILHYQTAVADGKYATPYKAYAALGAALLKTGSSAEAGVAFREAALDERNPDPTKALLNLGVCFMALDRPADAIASYESALPFDTDAATRNKIYANLGQAYVATGQMKKAVSAFEQALADKTYFLSDSAAVDYQKAIGQVSQGTDEFTPVAVDLAAQAEAMSMQPDESLSGLDISSDGTAVLDPAVYDQGGAYDDYGYDGYDEYQDYRPQEPAPGIVLPTDHDAFFNDPQAQAEWEKNMQKASKRRHPVLKFLVILLLIVIVAAGAIVFAYSQGYGYPTQEAAVTELFSNPSSRDCYVSGISEDKANSFQDIVVQDGNVSVDGVNRGMNESTVYATATNPDGGKVTYQITMSREGIGWKISNVQLYFASQN